MNKKIILGVLALLAILFFLSMGTATAMKEQVINEANLHASFSTNESKQNILLTVDVFEYNDKMYLYVGQDIRDQNGTYISGAYGSKILENGDFQIKINPKSVRANFSTDIILSQWYPVYSDIVLNNITVTWESDESPEITRYNKSDPEYPKNMDCYVYSKGGAIGSVNGINLGPSFHSNMEVSTSIFKV